MDFFESDDSIFKLEDVAGKVEPFLGNDFQPWHKPRKQYIREKQWLEHLLRTLKTSQYKGINTINYFGLPGGDLLDVIHLRNGMLKSSRARNKFLSVHGFVNNLSDYQRAQASMSKFLDNQNVSPLSKVENFSFESLGKLDSDAWKRVKSFGHYHFVNLDFCNNMLSEKTLTSMYYFLDYQLKRVIGLPWLLCITTRLNKESASVGIISKFEGLIEEIKSDGNISLALAECFGEAFKDLNSIKSLSSLGDKKFLNQLLQICLVLWFVDETLKSGCEISLKSSFKYSVDTFNPELDMHSFVFGIEKIDVVKPDTLGLVDHGDIITPKKSDIDYKKDALHKLSESLDVDFYLESNREELELYVGKILELLSTCGYNVAAYRETMREKYGCNL